MSSKRLFTKRRHPLPVLKKGPNPGTSGYVDFGEATPRPVKISRFLEIFAAVFFREDPSSNANTGAGLPHQASPHEEDFW